MIILGLGCNVGDRLDYLRQALKLLRTISELKIIQTSPVYQSDALLIENSPLEWNKPFLNCAVSCQTTLQPEQLLDKLKTIESQIGHNHNLKWAPRAIDIDILAWKNLCLNTPRLHLPHSELTKRPFAMWPLTDLYPTWQYCLPNTEHFGKTASEIVKTWGSRFDGNAPLNTKQIAHRIDTPLIMGILNITPDSFSDGGNFTKTDIALKQAQHLFASGADIIDIGAESTRPNSTPIHSNEEWSRLKPILEGLNAMWQHALFKPKLSVDTKNPEIAVKALAYDIDFLNDVTGFTNQSMLQVAQDSNVKLIYMHNRGVPPKANDIIPENEDVIAAVYQWASQQLQLFDKFGIARERLIFDVGIGFGKSADQSFTIIQNIEHYHRLGIPILVGHSRKSFLTKFTNKPCNDRDVETAIISSYLANKNIDYIRIHNVATNMCALKINAALPK
jgi:2-amino-4-hydroxy-6-hydroxymethyldihydropteridine diphosphokinase / dihydropteroate synthase